jgi:hypothetical protein
MELALVSLRCERMLVCAGDGPHVLCKYATMAAIAWPKNIEHGSNRKGRAHILPRQAGVKQH